MNDLLNLTMKAHGDLERWKQVRNMQAKVTLNGSLWRIKGRPDGLSGVVMRLNTKEPDLTITPFPKPGTAVHFTPNRVWIEDANGTVVSELKNPRDSFAGAVLTTKWNELQELYFASYAFWNYFTAPFLLALPGVEVEEIETHNEDGETWRQLSVIFPPEIPTHSAHQTFYFNDKGLLQRLDENLKDTITRRAGRSVDQVIRELSDFGQIRPLVTQGNITDKAQGNLTHSAATTEGGSGGPLFNQERKVIGINAAVQRNQSTQQDFSGGNSGIPISVGIDLLESAKLPAPKTN